MQFKKLMITFIMALAVFGFNQSAFAEAKTKKPAVAIEETIAKIQIALDAVATGKGEEVAALIKEASENANEIFSSYKVEFERDKAIQKLKSARKNAKNSALPQTEQELKEALKSFNDMKGML